MPPDVNEADRCNADPAVVPRVREEPRDAAARARETPGMGPPRRSEGVRALQRARRGRKGGTIKRIVERTNPRIVRVAALGTPTDKEKTQWYFQRYVAHLPSGGEIVLFDRSWYNRPASTASWGSAPTTNTTRSSWACPRVRNDADPLRHRVGEVLVLGERRGTGASIPRCASRTPEKRWKLSPMDLEARARWPTSPGPRTRCSATPTRSSRRGGS